MSWVRPHAHRTVFLSGIPSEARRAWPSTALLRSGTDKSRFIELQVKWMCGVPQTFRGVEIPRNFLFVCTECMYTRFALFHRHNAELLHALSCKPRDYWPLSTVAFRFNSLVSCLRSAAEEGDCSFRFGGVLSHRIRVGRPKVP